MLLPAFGLSLLDPIERRLPGFYWFNPPKVRVPGCSPYSVGPCWTQLNAGCQAFIELTHPEVGLPDHFPTISWSLLDPTECGVPGFYWINLPRGRVARLFSHDQLVLVGPN